MHRMGEVAHMSVVRLRSRRDNKEQASLEGLRDVLQSMAGAPHAVLERLVSVVEWELAARRGWRFVMVEPVLYAEVVVTTVTQEYWNQQEREGLA